jgi:zinc protease
MMFKGTKQFGKGEFSRIIKAKGGVDNAATYIDWTYYWQLMSKDHLELTLKLEADRMQNALFDPKEFEAERIVVRSELEGRESDPDTLLYDNMRAVAYQEHPYRWPTIGYLTDVEHITRDQVYKYYRTYYHPNNATIVIVGDVDTAKTIELVKKYFGKIPKGPEIPKVNAAEPKQCGERRFVIKREGTASRAMIAYHIPRIDNADTYPLMILAQILSGGRSTRLYQAMVEGHIATSAWAAASVEKDPSLFLLGATGSGNVSADKLETALLDQVEKCKTTPPSEDELIRAKNQIEAYLVMQNDSVTDQGEQLGNYESVISYKYLDFLLPLLKSVTGEDVMRVANKYLTEENRTVGWFSPTELATGGGQDVPEIGAVQFTMRPWERAAYYRPINTINKSKQGNAGRITSKAKISSSPTPSSEPEATVKPKRIVMKNGVVVIVQENHSNPTVAIRGSVKAGGIFEPKDKKGIASFTANMLSRGTNKRSALDIAIETDAVGAEVNVSSDDEAVRFSGKSLSKNFNLLLDVLSDELRNPSFPQDQIDRLKSQTISRLGMEKEDLMRTALRQFNRAIYPESHPFRPQTIKEDETATKSITRDDLVAFHKEYYGPETTIIVIVGDVKPDEAVAAVDKFLGDWQPVGPARRITIPEIPLAATPSKTIVPIADKSEVDVIYGFAGKLKRSDPDFYASNVMNNILGGGGGLDSRLGIRIREQLGLVYSVWSGFDSGLGDGPWLASFGTNPGNADKAVNAMDQVIRQYAKYGPTKKEFDEAIDYITGVFPIRLETNDGVANILSSAEFYGLGMDYIQKYPSFYRSVTIDQVKKAAQKHLNPDVRTLVIVGPYKEKNE